MYCVHDERRECGIWNGKWPDFLILRHLTEKRWCATLTVVKEKTIKYRCVRCRTYVSGEKGSRCESCTNSSPYFASRGMIHWETGKEIDALESNPEAMSRETCLSQYRNVTFVPRGTGSTKQESGHLPHSGWDGFLCDENTGSPSLKNERASFYLRGQQAKVRACTRP